MIIRDRRYYLALAVLLTLIGLPTRMDILPLPQPLLKYGGGLLWMMLIYVLLALIFNRARIRTLWLVTGLIAIGVEFSQLYQTEWLDAFRATIWGRLTIGRGFLWGDMLSYIVGVSLMAALEIAWLRTKQQVDSDEPAA